LVAPIHYITLKLAKIPIKPLDVKVRAAFNDQFADHHQFAPFRLAPYFERLDEKLRFPAGPFVKLAVSLALFIAFPALCWSVAELSALFNN
jgi:hypothetical protein